MKIDSNSNWSLVGSVRSTHTQDGAILLDVEKGLCYSLNAVAAKVWTTLEQSQSGISLSRLVDAIETHFHVPRPQLETDVAEHLEKLEKMGLVRRAIAARSKANS